MVNSFGKFCRKLRIDRGELLADMANRLGVSSAFLSKVENGGKKPPRDWQEKIVTEYQLDDREALELEDCMFEALNSQSIDMTTFSEDNRNMLLSFARKLGTMDDSKKDQFRKLMDK